VKDQEGRGLVFGRTKPRLLPWETGFAVRRDWPDRSHDFVDFAVAACDAATASADGLAYWLRDARPPTHAVVAISVRDFELHLDRRGCKSPDFPEAMLAVLATGEGSR
jgi:hypothetical protein